MAARKYLLPALAVRRHGAGGVEQGTGGVVAWCNTRAGINFVSRSACPAEGNDARWPPLRVSEEAGVLGGEENSHAAGLGRRRGCRRDQD